MHSKEKIFLENYFFMHIHIRETGDRYFFSQLEIGLIVNGLTSAQIGKFKLNKYFSYNRIEFLSWFRQKRTEKLCPTWNWTSRLHLTFQSV